MFVTVIVIIASEWNQLSDPSKDAWIIKIWDIYTMEFYSIVKKNETIKRLGKWTDIKDMKLSEVTQTQKDKKTRSLSDLNHSI